MRKSASTNPLTNKAEWEKQRSLAQTDPGKFHGDIAKREIHWFLPSENAWCRLEGDVWRGFDARDGSVRTSLPLAPDFNPWMRGLDESEAPFFQWFVGGRTNAAFNEVDAHVLAGYGEDIAFIFEGEDWLGDDRTGRPAHVRSVSRRELFFEVAKCALVLKDQGLRQGDRVVFYMSNSLEHIFLIEAAKRLGIIYTCVFGGLSPKTLAERIVDSGAKLVLTCDGFLKNGQIVDSKGAFVDVALDEYVAYEDASSALLHAFSETNWSEALKQKTTASIEATFGEEIVVSRQEFLQAFQDRASTEGLPKAQAERAAHALNNALSERNNLGIEAVLVVDKCGDAHTPPLKARDRKFEPLAEAAATRLDEAAKKASPNYVRGGKSETESRALVRAVYSLVPPAPVPADFPLFVAYTSGSTGKPKGVVHTHGGYVAGVAHTMKVSFGAEPGKDVIYAIADPGWITGQSYMISAALTARVTSLVSEAGPLYPFPARFASLVERYRVTILKAGSTFLRSVAAEPSSVAALKNYDLSSLKVASFCAEPVSPAIQRFGMDHLTERYINSYWATEHGGIAFTNFFANPDFALEANAHCFELPWVFGEVRIAETEFEVDGSKRAEFREARPGEKGEIAITRPYPYLARTLWGDPARVGTPEWRGDIQRFSRTYFERWATAGSQGTLLDLAYTQGDFACRYEDGSFTFHGRSDEVINTSGHRIGTEEIESAILKDKLLNPSTKVANAIVVGAPDEERGTVPVAFILINGRSPLTRDDEYRLTQLVIHEKGEVAAPAAYIAVSQFPETRSGKYMRRFLKAILNDDELGDTSTLRNPDSVEELKLAIQAWKEKSKPRDLRLVSPATSVSLRSLGIEDGTDIKRKLNEAEPAARRRLLHAVVHFEVARALRLEEGAEIDPTAQLMAYGINSLSAIKLRNQFKQLLVPDGAAAPPGNLLFKYPTLDSLVEHLLSEYYPDAGAKQKAGQADAHPDNTLDLAADVRANRDAVFSWSEPKKIFFTGATGYLGSFLLDELLRHSNATVYCLVRSSRSEPGEKRIAEAFRTQGIDRVLDKRVVAVSGDLSLPSLGLSREDYTMLAKNVDAIYHAGALVNHVYPYSALKQANVVGTEEVLRLAVAERLKVVHHISTIGVFLGDSHAGKFIGEWTFSDAMDDLLDGYCQSKWAAERLCRIALQRGVPVAIYRPGAISWHATTGAYNPADFVVNLLRLCLVTGFAPKLRTPFDLASIDYVVGAIYALSRTPDSISRAYSLTNPRLVHLPEVVALLNSLGHSIRTVPLAEWLKHLDVPALQEDKFAVSCRSYYSDPSGTVSGQLADTALPIFDVQNTLRGLEGTSIKCPTIDASYLSRLLDRLGLAAPTAKKDAV